MTEPIKALSQLQAAALLGVTPRRLRQIELENAAVARELGESGKPQGYPTEAFGRWLRARWEKSAGITQDGERLDPKNERALLDKVRREREELKLATERGELIPAEDIKQVWTKGMAVFRARLIALPSRLAGAVTAMGYAEAESAIRDEIYAALDELSAANIE